MVGVDSCSTDGSHRFDLADKGPIAYAIDGHSDLVLVVAGAHAIRNELEWAWTPPKPESPDPARFLATCAASLREHFTTPPLWGLVKDEDDQLDGHLIAAWGGMAVEISADLGVSIPRNGEVTIGSGRALALGALAATKGRPAQERVLTALAAAAEYAKDVAPPFSLATTTGEAAATGPVPAALPPLSVMEFLDHIDPKELEGAALEHGGGLGGPGVGETFLIALKAMARDA